MERQKKFGDNQRKIYEKMFAEGMSLEDVQKVMERYMEKVEGRRAEQGKIKELKSRKDSESASQPDWKTANPYHAYAAQPLASRDGLRTQK